MASLLAHLTMMLRRPVVSASLLLLASVAPSLHAQTVARLAQRPEVRALLDSIRANNDWTLQQQVSLC